MSAVIHFLSPGSGFDDPVGMWLACHQRVRRFVGVLRRLTEHLAQRGTDDEAQQAAAAIRRYFNEAAPRHHEDEEVDLFPLLLERGTRDPAIVAAIERIEAEHLTMAGSWCALDALLASVSAGATVALPAALAQQFGTAYDGHIAIEEKVLLPAMQRAFSASDWQHIGAAMAERRGVIGEAPPRPTRHL